MSENHYNNMGSGPLSQFLGQFDTAVNTGVIPNPYGLSADQLATLGDVNAALTIAIADRDAARADFHAKVAALATAQQAALAAIQSAAKTIYYTPGISDEMIAATGLAIHKTTKTDVTPLQPLDLVAVGTQSANKLEWSRGDNDLSVKFVVERQSSGGAWESISVTGKTRYSDSSGVPGAAYAYRVFATAAGRDSIPSAIATVFIETLPVSELEVAA